VSAIDFIVASCTDEVDAGGLRWRVQRVTNEEADKRRSSLILMVLPQSPAERAEDEDIAAIEDPEARMDALRALRVSRVARWHSDPARQAEAARNQAALIALGTTHVSADGGATWDPIALVAPEEEDLQASPPRVSRARFNRPTLDALFAAIWSLCTDGGAATERLERFRHRGA
jgi:hypothetical protein